MRINKLVNKVVSETAEGQPVENDKLDMSSMSKIHKKNIKFAEKTIEAMRIEVEEKLAATEDKEMTMKLRDIQRKLVAFEYLFLNINLLVLVPNTDQKIVTETLEDIEELKECFNNLGLSSSPNKKRKNSENTSEA